MPVNRPLDVAFVMDPFERMAVQADTSFALMESALGRGHRTFHVDPVDVGFDAGAAMLTARPCTTSRADDAPGRTGDPVRRPAGEFDVIWVRTDPPFDVDYLHATQLLALAEATGTVVINRPSGLQAMNEHLSVLAFPDVVPASCVSADAATLQAFMAAQGGRMVLKPIDGHGGEGVVVVTDDDRNRGALIELLTKGGAEPAFAQAYLPEVRKGDKRVLLLDGKPLGAVNRVPAEKDHRGNMHVGGRAEKAVLTERDLAVIDRIAPTLSAQGLWFAGIDLIGGWLTEINITSPTGIQEMSRFDGVDYSARVWEWLEARVSERRP